MIRIFLSFMLCLGMCTALGAVEKISVPLDKAKLEKGELQTFIIPLKTAEGLVKKRVIGVVIIEAPPARVWKVLEDWEAMPAFVPGLEYYKVLKRNSPAESIIEGTVKAGLIKILYTMVVRFDHAKLTQDWFFIKPEEVKTYNEKGIPVKKPTWNIKNVEGFEYIEPYGDGSRTIYYYAPVIEAKAVPEWIERLLAKRGLDGYMLGVKKKVEGK
jgi:carbon monoxide dehydrogenase subunit G